MKSKYQQILETEGLEAAQVYLHEVRSKAGRAPKPNHPGGSFKGNKELASQMGKKGAEKRWSSGEQTEESC